MSRSVPRLRHCVAIGPFAASLLGYSICSCSDLCSVWYGMVVWWVWWCHTLWVSTEQLAYSTHDWRKNLSPPMAAQRTLSQMNCVEHPSHELHWVQQLACNLRGWWARLIWKVAVPDGRFNEGLLRLSFGCDVAAEMAAHLAELHGYHGFWEHLHLILCNYLDQWGHGACTRTLLRWHECVSVASLAWLTCADMRTRRALLGKHGLQLGVMGLVRVDVEIFWGISVTRSVVDCARIVGQSCFNSVARTWKGSYSKIWKGRTILEDLCLL